MAGEKQTTKETTTMMLDPDDMFIETTEEVESFLSEYTKSEYDSYRPAYNDYDYDSDNYGYDY